LYYTKSSRVLHSLLFSAFPPFDVVARKLNKNKIVMRLHCGRWLVSLRLRAE